MRLGVETCAPYWHVARAVSLNLDAAIDEAGELVLWQRIPETLRKPAQVGRRRGQRGRHGTVTLASESVARTTILKINLPPLRNVIGPRARGGALASIGVQPVQRSMYASKP